ncbi:MAG: peptide chain release factor N(5)-glutamine methyltransferase [Bacteroidaceae bacterium]|nr:peptide chain release factor N(5)-glutamine methyltransferase [Bacteroidaceae bacterium]
MENPFVRYQCLLASLRQNYELREARAIALYVLKEVFGWSQTDVYIGKVKPFSSADAQKFAQILKRLEDGEPVQYVVGHTYFLGHKIEVKSGVLIPRPETEDLVQWVAESYDSSQPLHIVDCGTGSGAIAIALKLLFPQASVEAWDISADALAIARKNALRLGADVTFCLKDMAQLPEEAHRFDLCVSNPPYVLPQEKAEMAQHVLDYEPHEALFVPSERPLLHYEGLAASHLSLYVECNTALTDEVSALLKHEGYRSVKVACDRFGRKRMVAARW